MKIAKISIVIKDTNVDEEFTIMQGGGLPVIAGIENGTNKPIIIDGDNDEELIYKINSNIISVLSGLRSHKTGEDLCDVVLEYKEKFLDRLKTDEN